MAGPTRRSSLALTCTVTLGVLGTISTARGAPPAEAAERTEQAQPSERTKQAQPAREHARHADALGEAITFDEAVGASQDAPGLAGLEEAVEDRRRADDALPRLSQNPQIRVTPGARLPPTPDAGFEIQVSATQGWNLEGYGRARRDAAGAETDVMAAESRALALDQRLEAAHAWIELRSAERRLELAERELATAEALVAALEPAYEAGVVTRAELADARVHAAERQATVLAIAGEVHDSGLELAHRSGIRTTKPLQTRGDYPDPQLPPEDELRAHFDDLEKLPIVAVQRLEARAARVRARESETRRGTVLTTGVQVQRESTSEVILSGVVGLTIPVVDRNQRPRGQAQAEGARADAHAEALIVSLSAHLTVALHDLHHTREQFEILRDQRLPALDDLVAAREAALEVGEGTRPQLLAAQAEREAAQRELAAAEAEWVWARVEAWLYLQAILDGQSGAQP